MFSIPSFEVEEKTDLRAVIYHGAARKNLDEAALLAHDVVITTYGTCAGEFRAAQGGGDSGTLFNIAWWRVVLDEAHKIKNAKSVVAQSVSKLQCERKLALSGTPI